MSEIIKNLPADILDWISSDKITYLIADINRRFNIAEEKMRVIPKLIFRLATKELAPEDAAGFLAQALGKDETTLQMLITEIGNTLLEPIRMPLFRWGVDIRKISNVNPSTSLRIDSERIGKAPIPPMRPSVVVPPAMTPRPPRPVQPPPAPPSITKDNVSLRQAQGIITGSRLPIEPPPIPPRPKYPLTPPPETPLEEVIDLSTFQRKARPKPVSGEQPKINGNTIDLR